MILYHLKYADFKDLKATDDNGFVFLNPPYGQRLQPDETDQLYSMIGTTLKHNFPGTYCMANNFKQRISEKCRTETEGKTYSF